MKRTLLTLAAAIAALNLSADNRSDEILRTMRAKVQSMGSYRAGFSVTVEGQTLKGSYAVSGHSYRISTPDMEVYSDGSVKYEVNLADREILVDSVDPDDRTVMGNPTRLFDFLDGSYIHTYLGKTTVNGALTDEIELRSGNEKLRAFITSSTGLPVRLIYRLDQINADAVVDITDITPNITADRSAFNFDKSKYAGFEVIDFR